MEEYSTVIKYDSWLSSTTITNQVILSLSWLFCHSKTLEYIDTFFVLLKWGSPIFLLKYHHFGAVWSWFVLLYVDSSAVMISCLFNSFVHTIMYCYYFLSVFDTRKQLSPVRPFITSLQLIQLITGFCIGSTSYVMRHSSVVGWSSKYMISSYIVLGCDIILISLCLMNLTTSPLSFSVDRKSGNRRH